MNNLEFQTVKPGMLGIDTEKKHTNWILEFDLFDKHGGSEGDPATINANSVASVAVGI